MTKTENYYTVIFKFNGVLAKNEKEAIKKTKQAIKDKFREKAEIVEVKK